MKLKYNAFRALHKGQPQSEISQLWKEYKAGDYEPPTEEPVVEVVEEPPVEEPAPEPVVAPEPAPPAPTQPVEPPTPSEREVGEHKMNLCNDFNRAVKRYARFGATMKEDEVKKYKARLSEIAKETMPKGYSCSPTDSWKIWFGPTSQCLLINVTHEMAFKVDRDWWQRNYQTTVYVDRSLLKTNDLMDSEALRYAKKGRYLPRYPLVGVECQLPQSYHDIKLR